MKLEVFWRDADPVIRCECGQDCRGDSGMDAWRAWWEHAAREHPGWGE